MQLSFSQASILQIRRQREKVEFLLANFLSLLAHLLIFSLFNISILQIFNKKTSTNPIEIIEFQLEPIKEQIKQTRDFIDSSGLSLAEKPPNDAQFESDRNTIAASEKQGSGPAWLPKIEGHNTPFLELEESELSFENNQKLKSNTIVTSEILPSHSHNEHVIENPNSVSQQTLKQSIASESITQMEIVPKDKELEIHTKNIENTSIELPTKVELENLQPSIQQPLSQIKPSPTNESTYQPQKRISRIEGGISNRGKSSVSAVGTPLGKYKKALTDAIGSRWYFYIKQNLSLMTVGTAIIRFYVMPSGKVSGVKVLSNTSSESFASVSIRAIVDAEIPPMPPEVAELLENNRIEVDYTFSIFSN